MIRKSHVWWHDHIPFIPLEMFHLRPSTSPVSQALASDSAEVFHAIPSKKNQNASADLGTAERTLG